MKEVEQYLHGRKSILQRELMHLEARVKSMIREIEELKESIEYQKQLGEQHENNHHNTDEQARVDGCR